MTDHAPQGRPRAPKLPLGLPLPSPAPQPVSELRRCLEPMFEPLLEPVRPQLPTMLEPGDDAEPCPPTQRAPLSPRPSDLEASHAVVSVEGSASLVLSVRGAAPRSEPRPAPSADEGGSVERDAAHCGPASTRLEEEFFRFDSFAPVTSPVAEPEPDPLASEPPSPAVLVRRRRLRTGVGAVLGATVALMVAALVYGTLLSSGGLPAAHAGQPPARAAARADGAAALGAPARAVAPTPVALDHPAATPTPPAAAAPAAEATTPSGTSAELAHEAVQLLIRGQRDQAAEWARALIAAEPDSAFGYLCLGSAQQDQGNWVEAHRTYAECAHRAKHGDVGECVALGGRR
jgi:hypothetical protein